MPYKTMFSLVIEEIWLLLDAFRKCSFGHLNRQGNQLANSLAIRVVLFVDIDVWVEDLSSKLDVVFQTNLLHL